MDLLSDGEVAAYALSYRFSVSAPKIVIIYQPPNFLNDLF